MGVVGEVVCGVIVECGWDGVCCVLLCVVC